ncbi:MAG: PAS domain-containing protein [Haliscomenobacter sp.]|nr:PAS domain-containing protein [Haliscomenobacter sp.]
MTLRLKYIFFVVFLHLVILLLTFKLLSENKVLFIASEAFLLASLYFSFRLYRSFIEPLRVLLAGVEAIRSQDFTVKFRKVGQKELDQLIQVYNDIIDHLRKERTQLAEQHFFLEKLLHALPVAVILLDYDERISDLNPQAGALFGVGNRPVRGLRIRELPHPLAPLLDGIPEGGAQAIQVNGVERYKAQRSFFMDRGFKRHFMLVEELTAEMLETEKRSYGKVIRMMAHEVNNSIGPVNSILDSTARHLQTLAMEEDRFVEALEIAMARNERLNQFMRRFADVVRLPAPLYENKNAGGIDRRFKRHVLPYGSRERRNPQRQDRRSRNRKKTRPLPGRASGPEHLEKRAGCLPGRGSDPDGSICQAFKSLQQRDANTGKRGAVPVHPVFQHQARRSGNRTDPHPGNPPAARMEVRFGNPKRRLDGVPHLVVTSFISIHAKPLPTLLSEYEEGFVTI